MLRLVRGSRRPDEGEPADAAGGARATDDLAPLAQAARRGEPRATPTLLAAVAPAVLKVARSVLGPHNPDVEDVVQESLVGFLGALTTFRGQCSTLHFASRVATLTALKARRRVGSRPDIHAGVADGAEGIATTDATPLQLVVAARRREAVRALLAELPAPQGEALTMHLLLGYSVTDIAAAADAPAPTIRSRLRLAKEALRARIATDPSLDDALRDEVTP